MRLGNFNVIMRALREGNVSWLWRQGSKYAAIQIASRTLTEPLTGPLMGRLVTTYRCNERCLMCDLPFRAEPSDREELTTATWCRIVDEMVAEGTSGIGITGGEPLLRQDTPELVARIRKHGLPVTVNTNGLLLNRPKVLGSLLAADPTNINISIDAVEAPLHDHLRGLDGSWELLSESN